MPFFRPPLKDFRKIKLMMNPPDRRILVVTCFGHYMSHFNTLVFPAAVLLLDRRLDIDMAQVPGISFWWTA